jgi:hypothetical protein
MSPVLQHLTGLAQFIQGHDFVAPQRFLDGEGGGHRTSAVRTLYGDWQIHSDTSNEGFEFIM